MPLGDDKKTDNYAKLKLWKQNLGVLLLSYEAYFTLLQANSQQLQEVKYYLQTPGKNCPKLIKFFTAY